MPKFISFIFVIFLPYITFSQLKCGTLPEKQHEKEIKNFFKNYQNNKLLIESKRNLRLLTENTDIIIIKRHLVKKSNGLSPVIPTLTEWNNILEITNNIFQSTSTVFIYDNQIDVINSDLYYDHNEQNEYALYTENNLPNVINVYVVNSIDGDNETLGKAPIPYYNVGILKDQLRMIYGRPFSSCDFKSVLAHELGHYFGLAHTQEDAFGQELIDQSNSNDAGDFLLGTKADSKHLENFTDSNNCILSNIILNEHLDCDGNKYLGYLEKNLMSYHKGCQKVIVNDQKNVISFVKEKYHGNLYKQIWALPNYHSIPLNIPNPNSGFFCSPQTINFSSITKGNVIYSWTFLGGNPSTSNSASPNINYSSYGIFPYQLTVTEFGTNQPLSFSSAGIIEISDKSNVAKPLPFIESFENGLPNNNSGWEFNNLYKDCQYFSSKYVGGFGQSLRSLCMDNFNGAVGDIDQFITPYLNITNLQTLKLDFDYAYASKVNNFDTLYLSYILCNDLIEFGKKGGVQLSTHPIVNNIQFVPLVADWRRWNTIDLSDVLANPINKTIRIVFAVKSGNGNRLYIDNIRISGQSISATNNMVAVFNRTNHKNELTWPDFAADETSYKVERSYTEDGPWTEIATLPTNTTTFSELATFSNTIYWYRVKAISPTLTLPYSNVDTDTSCNIPNRPFPLIVTTPGISSRTANLSWVDNNNFETGYDIFYSFNRYGPYDTLVKLPANTTSYQHTNTPLGSRIFYFVKAVEVNYFSLPSDTGLVNFQTLPNRTLSTIEWNIDNINTAWSSINVSGFYAVDRTINVSMLGYSNGVHTLYVKSTDNTGKQSNIFTQTFLRTIGDNGANKILKFAYYFDDDNPAITNPINGSTLSYDVSNISGNDFSFPINISSLNDGLHTAHLRALDNLGTWSNVWSGTFIKLPGGGTKEITKVEYFIDSDPGFGLAFNVPINAKEKLDTTLNFGLGSVSDGVHTLFMRAKDAQGLWSNVFSKNFIRFQGAAGEAITQIEYYYDTDPGIGSGLNINFPVPRANADTIVTLNLATLVDGLHTLYARAKDVKGLWSNIYSKNFLKMQGTGGAPKITKMEYYIDSDPGLGLANNIDTTGHSNGIYNLNVLINTISDGPHTLYIRAKDNRNLWSIIYSGLFNKVNDLDCPCAKIVYTSGINAASSYQWQVDTGTGFQNISDTGVYFGTHLDSLKISNPPTNYSFNKYRCAITTGAGVTYSNIFILRYNMRWTGNDDTEWNTISNWGCYTLPDDKTDVTIPGNKVNYPEINSNKAVNSIKLNTGSSLKISVGVKFDIKSRQN